MCFADAEDWRREDGLFAEVSLFQPVDVDLSGPGDPERTSRADSTAWSTMAGVVLLSTLLACAVPAWRAASTDPVSALRE